MICIFYTLVELPLACFESIILLIWVRPSKLPKKVENQCKNQLGNVGFEANVNANANASS